MGHKEKILENLSLLKEADKGSPLWFIALYYCHEKDYNTAFEWFEKSLQNNEGELIWLHSEPLLRPVRSDPRYVKLHKALGFPGAPT